MCCVTHMFCPVGGDVDVLLCCDPRSEPWADDANYGGCWCYATWLLVCRKGTAMWLLEVLTGGGGMRMQALRWVLAAEPGCKLPLRY